MVRQEAAVTIWWKEAWCAAMERPSEHDAPPPAADSEALRCTRFEFGGRRPYSFVPPRVAERAAGRPLPGIGTVAIGQVSRIVPYGAFVDFLGFRGMIHVSQLLPGQRVERVEDVVQLQDEVQVRVIGVDPERRHINLVLVNKVGSAPAPEASDDTPVDLAQPAEAPATSAPTTPAPASEPKPRAAAAPSTSQPVRPVARPSAPVAKRVVRPEPKPVAKPAAPAPAVAQHGARAIRRELADPRHPMARLLASAGPSSIRPAGKERAAPEEELAQLGRPAPVAPEPPRPVHVFGPDPEPEQEQPATLEALAARFGQRREAPSGKPTKSPAERSRQEREKQAQILAKLREDAAKFAK